MLVVVTLTYIMYICTCTLHVHVHVFIGLLAALIIAEFQTRVVQCCVLKQFSSAQCTIVLCVFFAVRIVFQVKGNWQFV